MTAMQVVTVSTEELRSLISEAVEDALAKNPAREEWMDTAACARHLSTTENSVRDLVYRSGLPAHKAPGTARLLFRPSEIDRWVAGGAS